MGNAKAMAYLGVCFEKGQGVEKDLAKTVALYQRAVDFGDARAMIYLGVCYHMTMV